MLSRRQKKIAHDIVAAFKYTPKIISQNYGGYLTKFAPHKTLKCMMQIDF